MQGAAKMSCGKIRKDLARPNPSLDGAVCASKMWVAYLCIEANIGVACPCSGSFPHKVGNLLSPNHSSCHNVPRNIEGCSGVSPTWEDSKSLLRHCIAVPNSINTHLSLLIQTQPVGCSAAEPLVVLHLLSAEAAAALESV